MGEVRIVTDHAEWDSFVESSPQGTIFSTARWMDLFNKSYQIWGYYKGDTLYGGAANFDEPQPLTPFQGVLVRPMPDMKYATMMSLHNEVATELLEYLPLEFFNHYTFCDMRPFKWDGLRCAINYTYVVSLSSLTQLWTELEKSTRYEINRCSKNGISLVYLGTDTAMFDKMYNETFDNKGLDRPVATKLIQSIFANLDAECLVAFKDERPSSAVVTVRDRKRAYYILGASNHENTSAFTLWQAFHSLASRGVKEIDLVGCNDQKIGLFKRGFGGKLRPYYGVRDV